MPDPPSRTSKSALAPKLTKDLMATVPALLDEVVEFFGGHRPVMAQFMRQAREEVEAGSTIALERLAVLTVRVLDGETLVPGPDPDVQDVLFAEIGRAHWRRGDDLASLLSTYQSSARLAWRHLSARLLDAGHSAQTLAALADALFFVVDEMSSASADGYVSEQSEGARSRERLRAELVELILAGSPNGPALQAVAARAGWRLPHEVAIVVVESDTETGRSALDRLDTDVLSVRRDGRLGAILPNPSAPGRRDQLLRALKGLHAVVGFPVPLDSVPASAVIVAGAARLQREGVLTDDPVFVDEHLDALIVHRDAKLLEALRTQVLRPLNDAPRVSRARLAETLTSWLRNLGDRQAVAHELNIHPQTVRYRLGVLHDVFGEALDDPRARAKLMLALAWGPSEIPG